MRTILITGGAGFIGINLSKHYLKDNHVVIFDNLSRPHVGDNLSWLNKDAHAKNLEFIQADVRDQEALDQAVNRADIIFHEAGQTAVTTSLTQPFEDFSINALGTMRVLESLRLHNPKATLIFASTNKVYGNLEAFNLTQGAKRYEATGITAVDESQPLDFHSPYGCSKGSADQYVRDYARSFGLKTIVFRQSCIYGVHQMGVEDQGWVAHFAAKALRREPITIYGDGKQVRDLLYITDLVAAYDQALVSVDTTKGEIYNIGGGVDNAYSLLEVISFLEHALGYAPEITFMPERVGDQKYYVSDVAKAKRDFAWQPTTPFATGLEQLLAWLKEYAISLAQSAST